MQRNLITTTTSVCNQNGYGILTLGMTHPSTWDIQVLSEPTMGSTAAILRELRDSPRPGDRVDGRRLFPQPQEKCHECSHYTITHPHSCADSAIIRSPVTVCD